MKDYLARELEYFIRNGGDIKRLKEILSVSQDDKELLKNLYKEHYGVEVERLMLPMLP